MKRVGTLTFHRTNNYGASLQTYALQHVLNGYYSTEIIDYRSSYLESLFLMNRSKRHIIRGLIRDIVYPFRAIKLRRRNERFLDFYKQYFVLSPVSYTEEDIVNSIDKYDVLITGSDQVWNPHLSRHDWNYFLEFAPPYKRYSYAASMSSNNTEEDIKRIKNDLNEFQSILVRENSAVDYLSSIGVDREIKAVCDPVFLMTADEWIKALRLKKGNDKGKYVILYTVANAINSAPLAKRISEKEGFDVLSISSKQSIKLIEGVKNILDAGPVEFLNYILNAECIVTSSFHALAFALIFNVPFYFELCQDGSNNNERLSNIAEIFSVSDREIKNCNEINFAKHIDWEYVNQKMIRYRETSMTELLMSLRSSGEEVSRE